MWIVSLIELLSLKKNYSIPSVKNIKLIKKPNINKYILTHLNFLDVVVIVLSLLVWKRENIIVIVVVKMVWQQFLWPVACSMQQCNVYLAVANLAESRTVFQPLPYH